MSARDAAAKVQPGSTVRWGRLERAAFAAHPFVLEQHRPVPLTKNNWVALLLILGAVPYFLGAHRGRGDTLRRSVSDIRTGS